MRNREVGTKHVFAGGTRLVSKLVVQPKDVDGYGEPDPLPGCDREPWGWTQGNGGQGQGQGVCSNNGNGPGAGPEVFEKDQYYFHPDHLGSSSYVTDLDGEIFQHLEYFPFGETWVEEHSNTQRTPYLFTAKELDEETGLYYFGARYYDARTSLWQSPDPILGSYVSGGPNGGVQQPVNLSLYAYSRQNPVGFSDSSGEFWGAASKLLKLAIKGGDVAATFAGVVEDTSTLFSSDATFGERLLAAGSLATEIVSPVSARDVKAGINATEAILKRQDDVRDLGQAARRFCSFDGETLVLTAKGPSEIESLHEGDLVWSRDAKTGAMGWKRVLAVYSNAYKDTVSITIRDADAGEEQVILSNKLHPFFVQIVPEDRQMLVAAPSMELSSEGHLYEGPIANGFWVDASDLKPGFRLLGADQTWSTVVSVEIANNKLTAWNLTVEDYSTYFVSGDQDSMPVWVHNNCSRLTPDMGNYKPSHAPDAAASIDPRIPAKVDGGPTIGVIETPNGPVYLSSRGKGPGSQYLPGPPTPDINSSASHVEGHAAALMRENGVTDLTVTINHPGGPCGTCRGTSPSSVAALLPKGSTLTVRWMDEAGQLQSLPIKGLME